MGLAWVPREPGFLTKLDDNVAASGISTFSSKLSRLSYVLFVVLRTGVRNCVGVCARVFVSCMPASNTTSSENVGEGAIVTRDSFLSIDFGVLTPVVAAKITDSLGGSAFSKSALSADSPG